LSTEIRDFIFNIGVVNTIQNYLDELSSHANADADGVQDDASESVMVDGSVRLNNVSYAYPGNANRYIFKNFSVVVPDKSKLAIVGPNGGGKSTLFKMMLKLVKYDGNIYIGDVNLKDINSNTLRSHISFVPQNPKLFNRSIYDNICYGITGCTRETVDSIMIKHNLHKSFKNLDSLAGIDGMNLSGGQRQLVFWIRCLLKNNPIVLMDEPTSSLDMNNKNMLFRLLDELMRDRTVIIITHDDFILNKMDQVLKIGAFT